MTEPFIDPACPAERRAAWLDRGLIRRVKAMTLQELLSFRIQHCRLWHRGSDFWDSCWTCHLVKRWTDKRMLQPRAKHAR